MKYMEELPDLDAYWDLFASTGWNEEYGFTKEELSEALQESWYAVSAYKAEHLVGFGRVISDGVHHALIVDLIVDPAYQQQGIGAKILEVLVDRCLSQRIRDVQLFAAHGKLSFYEKRGFKSRLSEAPGMELIQPTNRNKRQ